MDKPNFIPGQKVKFNLARLENSDLYKELLEKYGAGPFEIDKVKDLPSDHLWAKEHPQWVRIKTSKGEIEVPGAVLLPA